MESSSRVCCDGGVRSSLGKGPLIYLYDCAALSFMSLLVKPLLTLVHSAEIHMKKYCWGLMFLLICVTIVSAQQTKTIQKPDRFTEGIIYSRATFPGHLVNDSLKRLDAGGDDADRHHVVQLLKKYQQSIKGENEQEIKDQFFISGMLLMPIYSQMYYSPLKVFVKTDALGYQQQLLLNKENHTGKLVVADLDKINRVTVNFNLQDLNEVWQKYLIDAAQYRSQQTNETALIAGYPCKKMIYTFGGTSRGSGVSNYIINMQPQKLIVWYSDDLPPSINLVHPHDFELQKAVLKYEVEYDKVKKNNMLVEIIKLERQKIEEEVFELKDKAPVVAHVKSGSESGMMIMQVMMNAISLLTK